MLSNPSVCIKKLKTKKLINTKAMDSRRLYIILPKINALGFMRV
jgi:hypothetical protein